MNIKNPTKDKKVTAVLNTIADNYITLQLCNGEWMGNGEAHLQCLNRINLLVLFGALYKSHVTIDYYKCTDAEGMKEMMEYLLERIFNGIEDRVEEYEDGSLVDQYEATIVDAMTHMVNENYKCMNYEACTSERI